MELKCYNSFHSVYFPNSGMETFHKISKQWNGISIPFRSIPFHSISFYSVTFHQSKRSLRLQERYLYDIHMRSPCWHCELNSCPSEI